MKISLLKVIGSSVLTYWVTDKRVAWGYVHSMEAMALAVEEVLRHLKIRRSVMIGHSMGGYVALAFAEKNPDALKGLCLMNSTAKGDSKEKKKES